VGASFRTGWFPGRGAVNLSDFGLRDGRHLEGVRIEASGDIELPPSAEGERGPAASSGLVTPLLAPFCGGDAGCPGSGSNVASRMTATLAIARALPSFWRCGGEATLFQPIGLALDSDGVLYVSEFGNNDIRRIDTLGNVTTVAGGGGAKLRDGTGVEARFNQPRGLAIDSQRGFLYVADYENLVIRKIVLR